MMPLDIQSGGGPLIFGRVLDGAGGCRPIDWDEGRVWRPGASGEVLWLHICRSEPGVREWLEDVVGVSEPTAELLTSDDTRPRALREGETLVATLRGINFNAGAEPEDMVSMQLWSDGRRVITLRRHPLQTPRDTLADLEAGHGAVDAGALITSLTEYLIIRMSHSVIDMNDHLDELEAADPEQDPQRMLGRIATIRRNCLALKRHMSPQHEALERIARDAPAWFEQHDRREIAEAIDRLKRYLDDIDISKESALVLQDDLRARAAARTERTSYLLSVIAAIFLPLGFVTGLLGINVGGIPGVSDPRAFWVVVGMCGGIFAMQLALFWRWKLF